MAHTNSDRRRFYVATLITLLALPALWWANESRDGAPNVATAGVVVGGAAEPTVPSPAAAAASNEFSDAPPVFLDGPAGQVGAARPEVAVPATPGERIETTATFRSDLPSATTCLAPGISNGGLIVVVNLDNGRSITCTTMLAPAGSDALVLSTSQFLEIADPTDAPIPVEIRR